MQKYNSRTFVGIGTDLLVTMMKEMKWLCLLSSKMIMEVRPKKVKQLLPVLKTNHSSSAKVYAKEPCGHGRSQNQFRNCNIVSTQLAGMENLLRNYIERTPHRLPSSWFSVPP